MIIQRNIAKFKKFRKCKVSVCTYMLQFSEHIFRDAEFVKLGLNVVDDIVDDRAINCRLIEGTALPR